MKGWRPRIGWGRCGWVVLALVCVVPLAAGCGIFGKRDVSPDDTIYLHKVRTGETLSDVAEEYYGDAGRAAFLARVNDIEGVELQPGSTLRVPLDPQELVRVKDREMARIPYNEGLTLVEKGAYLDAVQRFQAALRVDPDFIDAAYNLGVALQKMKSYEKALDQFRLVTRKRPHVIRYQFAMGTAYFHLERYGKAAAAFEVCLEREPAHTKALYSLAVCYEKVGERDKARATWERYLELDDESVWANEARRRLRDLD